MAGDVEDSIMNDQTDMLDRAEEEILTATASDEALEAAVGTSEIGGPNAAASFTSAGCCELRPHC